MTKKIKKQERARVDQPVNRTRKPWEGVLEGPGALRVKGVPTLPLFKVERTGLARLSTLVVRRLMQNRSCV